MGERGRPVTAGAAVALVPRHHRCSAVVTHLVAIVWCGTVAIVIGVDTAQAVVAPGPRQKAVRTLDAGLLAEARPRPRRCNTATAPGDVVTQIQPCRPVAATREASSSSWHTIHHAPLVRLVRAQRLHAQPDNTHRSTHHALILACLKGQHILAAAWLGMPVHKDSSETRPDLSL